MMPCEEQHHFLEGPSAQQYEPGSADGDSERVCRYEMSCLDDVYTYASGDVAQYSHHAELGDAKCECSDCKCDETLFHFWSIVRSIRFIPLCDM